MDTETPSLADITVHFPWVWMQQFRALRDLFDRARFPATIAVRPPARRVRRAGAHARAGASVDHPHDRLYREGRLAAADSA